MMFVFLWLFFVLFAVIVCHFIYLFVFVNVVHTLFLVMFFFYGICNVLVVRFVLIVFVCVNKTSKNVPRQQSSQNISISRVVITGGYAPTLANNI